ncbi:MAG: 5-oxoprolinase subunit PxpA [Actinomycetota bacterium]|nr:5-oxoprolinase subunit PxpA [Actinomycetota bacterium]
MAAPGRIDLNSDVGEGFGAWPGGPDEEMMRLLTSVNVACGYHAGDPLTMRTTCALAREYGCVIGAQVSYPDLLGFGRRFLDMQPDDLAAAVVYQLGALEGFARLAGGRVHYVKPHGALYNAIVEHEAQAAAVASAVHDFDSTLAVMGLPRSAIMRACERRGLRFVKEGFADRRYTPDGLLVPRTQPDALITDPTHAAEQALRLAEWGVESICVHSDTPGAPAILSSVARHLAESGMKLQPFLL